MTEFEWDDNKNESNIYKHGISFDDAKGIFYNETIDILDTRKNYGEIRINSIGKIENENSSIYLNVTHTSRGENIRIISARMANSHERDQYILLAQNLSQSHNEEGIDRENTQTNTKDDMQQEKENTDLA